MSDESKQEVSMQPDSSSESASEDESAPTSDALNQNYYDKVIAESLAENMYNLIVESDQDDDDDDLNPSPSSQPPNQPFVFDNYAEDDFEESDIDHKISKIAGLEHLIVNSPLWYARVKPYLTLPEREKLWNRTPWKEKMYWNWDDSEDSDADYDEVAPLIFNDQYYIAFI
nr:ribosome biogenesis protein erb1-like [Vanessa tameamea]